jgi:hypothetical protein
MGFHGWVFDPGQQQNEGNNRQVIMNCSFDTADTENDLLEMTRSGTGPHVYTRASGALPAVSSAQSQHEVTR